MCCRDPFRAEDRLQVLFMEPGLDPAKADGTGAECTDFIVGPTDVGNQELVESKSFGKIEFSEQGVMPNLSWVGLDSGSKMLSLCACNLPPRDRTRKIVEGRGLEQ